MDFYRITEEYIRFLQKYKKQHRGITKVPNIRYQDRNKFAFGAVLEIKGSLRFNYMIHVPDECLERLVIKDIEDVKYRLLVNKEYNFCIGNAEKIQKKADKIYQMVTTNVKQILTDNSCDFRLLEEGCRQYIKQNIQKSEYTKIRIGGIKPPILYILCCGFRFCFCSGAS